MLIDNLNLDNYDPNLVVVTYEMTIYFGKRKQTNVDQIKNSIYILSTGYETYRVTVILSINRSSSGQNFFLISKDKQNTVITINRVYILEPTKAWSTQKTNKK